MTASRAKLDPPAGGLRQTVARHPVAGMLIAMFTVGWLILIPAALAGLPLEPFLLLVVLFGQLLPAVMITAAIGGRPALRELFSRVFRWRVNPLWYAMAFLLIPTTALLATAAVWGTGALHALASDRSVILGYLNALTILPLVNLWEETAWMGMVQARLAVGRGPLLAAVITGPLFTLIHAPLRFGQPFGELVLGILFAAILGIGLRILIGWMYYVGGASILLAAIMHVSFNATNNGTLLTSANPHSTLLEESPWLIIGILGLLVAVLTRGRLGAPERDGELETFGRSPEPPTAKLG